MPTCHWEETTRRPQSGFGNGTLLPHRALFPRSGIRVREAPAWVPQHSEGVPIRTGLSGCQSCLLSPVSLGLNRSSGILSLVPWVLTPSSPAHSPVPKVALQQSLAATQVPSLLQPCGQTSSLTLWDRCPPSTCSACVRERGTAPSLFTPLHAQTPLLQLNFSEGLLF